MTQISKEFRNNTDFGKENKEVPSWIDASILIGFLSILGYTVAYAYQTGYLLYYGVTDIFLNNITIVQVVISASILVAMLFIFFASFDSFKNLFREFKHPILVAFQKSIMPYLFMFIFLLPFTFDYIVYMSIFLAILTIITYLSPLWVKKGVKGYLNKLRSKIKSDNHEFSYSNVKNNLKRSIKYKIISIIFVFVIAMPLGRLIGYKNAELQREYYYFNHGDADYLVIDNIGSDFIVAPLDIDTHQILKEYQVIEMRSNMNDPIIFKRIRLKDGVKF